MPTNFAEEFKLYENLFSEQACNALNEGVFDKKETLYVGTLTKINPYKMMSIDEKKRISIKDLIGKCVISSMSPNIDFAITTKPIESYAISRYTDSNSSTVGLKPDPIPSVWCATQNGHTLERLIVHTDDLQSDIDRYDKGELKLGYFYLIKPYTEFKINRKKMEQSSASRAFLQDLADLDGVYGMTASEYKLFLENNDIKTK